MTKKKKEIINSLKKLFEISEKDFKEKYFEEHIDIIKIEFRNNYIREHNNEIQNFNNNDH